MADADIKGFFAALDESLAGDRFVKLTLAKPRARGDGPKNVYVRPVTLKGGGRLSFLYRYRTRDETKNYAPDEGARRLREMLGSEFLSGHLFTTAEDLRLDFNRKGESRLARHAPTFRRPPPPRTTAGSGAPSTRRAAFTCERSA